jgi:hypothetical protein
MGEMSMSRPLTTTRRHSHGRVNQLDLFAGSPGLAMARTPPWQTLPMEAREAVTRLIVRLMIAHLDGDRGLDRKEVRDDL